MNQEIRKPQQQLLGELGRRGTFKVAPEIDAKLRQISRRDGGCSDELLDQARRGNITIASEENKEFLKRQRGEITP